MHNVTNEIMGLSKTAIFGPMKTFWLSFFAIQMTAVCPLEINIPLCLFHWILCDCAAIINRNFLSEFFLSSFFFKVHFFWSSTTLFVWNVCCWEGRRDKNRNFNVDIISKAKKSENWKKSCKRCSRTEGFRSFKYKKKILSILLSLYEQLLRM